MNQVNENRSGGILIAYIVLSWIGIVTMLIGVGFVLLLVAFILWFCILFWKANVIKDLNTICSASEGNHSQDVSFGMLILLSIVTLGIYTFFWFNRVGKRLKEASNYYQAGVSDSGDTYVLWNFVGLILGVGTTISWIKLNNNLNMVAHLYNQGGQRQVTQTTHQRIENVTNNDQPRFDPKTGKPLTSIATSESEIYESFASETPVEKDEDDDKTVFYSHKILFNNGEYKDASIELADGQTITLGRDGKVANLVFSESSISKKHCTISWNQIEGCFIVHDYSSNGTYYLNGKRLEHDADVKCPVNTVIKLADGKNVMTLL